MLWLFSRCGEQGLLIAVASSVVEYGLFGTRALVVAAPGLENTGSIGVLPVAPRHVGSSWIRDQPTLAEGFFTTEPPGKPSVILIAKYKPFIEPSHFNGGLLHFDLFPFQACDQRLNK